MPLSVIIFVMARHFMTVCVFCLLCATHSPCSAHVEFSPNEKALENSQVLDIRQAKIPPQPDDPSPKPLLTSAGKLRSKRDAHGKNRLDEAVYLEKIFAIFGNGESMDYEGFESFIKSLNLDRLIMAKFNGTLQANSTNASTVAPNRLKSDNITCLGSKELLKSVSHETHSHPQNASEANFTVDSPTLRSLCPILLYQMVAPTSLERQGCVVGHADHDADHKEHTSGPNQAINNIGSVWLYSILSIIIISTCGLLGVLVIPIMQQHFYQHLIQFLVALAVGTLSGDALLHLLPHSMMSHEHSHAHAHPSDLPEEDPHTRNLWRGFVAMMGLIFFFFMEKCLTLGAEWRKQRQLRKNKVPTRVRIMRDPDTNNTNSVGEKLCKHKYSSYPYCYDVIATETQDDLNNRHNNVPSANIEMHNHATITSKDPDSDTEFITRYCPNKPEANQNLSKCTNASKSIKCSESNKMLADNVDSHTNEDFSAVQNESYTVILREHENKHHGHSHKHGHVHSAPKNMSSVAWMVIMGDGLHNFTDGMAIGAAFAGSLAGGFSTSVAVFCHELPHEIGDFAVLLKAGMTAKQAVVYNMLSSILCMFGMIFGVSLGNSEMASSWIFACAAGMFLYIALVDMIPELTTSHSKEGGSFLQCGLQFMGLLSGLGIMLLIALYEQDLKKLFEE